LKGISLLKKEERDARAWMLDYRLDKALRLQEQAVKIAKYTNNPTQKNKAKLQALLLTQAFWDSFDQASAKLNTDFTGLEVLFAEFGEKCEKAIAEQDLTAQIAQREQLEDESKCIKGALAGLKLDQQINKTLPFQRLSSRQGAAVLRWNTLQQMIKTRLEEEKRAYEEARQKAKDAEWDLMMKEAEARETSQAQKKKTAPKQPSRELKRPDTVRGGVVATQIYQWAYNHATDVNQENWRAAYHDPNDRPLGPSYPARETISFPGGVRHVVPLAQPIRVSLADAQEVRRLWAPQSFEIPGGHLGTQIYVTATTNPHGTPNHINLVLEDGNKLGRPSVLNLHVRIV
jgi:hypothetical protein